MHAFILAGGFATRLWPLTEKRAKPLLPLAGVPLIEHLINAIPEGIAITVSTNAIFEDAFAAWKKTLKRDVEILIEQTRKDDEKLGALGATAQWIEQKEIQDDVLLLTGDNYCGFSIQDFINSHTPGTALVAAHDIDDLEKAKAFGTVITSGGTDHRSRITQVVGFEEKPKSPKTTLVSTGCALLPASVLPILTEFAKTHPDNVGGIFEELLRRGQEVQCFIFSEPWFDVGSFEAYLEATRAIVGPQVIKEAGSAISNSETHGSVVLGERSRVQNCSLTDVVLFEDCVLDDCVLRNCILDRGCTLRGIDLTGKMLREATILEKS